MKYFVTVNGRDYNIEYDEQSPAIIRINGKAIPFDFQQGTHPENVHLILDHQSLMFWMEKNHEGYHAHCLGHDFNIMVEDERTRRLRTVLKVGGGRSVAGIVRASMPGMIVKITVEAGQMVRKGQGLLIVEAMKMENEIKSPIDGKVLEIRVAPLQTVEKGETLLMIEPEAETSGR
jgi:pyruvate carboxylase subunit B